MIWKKGIDLIRYDLNWMTLEFELIEWNRKKEDAPCTLVYLPNLDVGEGHETLDINWEWGAYQVRLDDYFEQPGGKKRKQ